MHSAALTSDHERRRELSHPHINCFMTDVSSPAITNSLDDSEEVPLEGLGVGILSIVMALYFGIIRLVIFVKFSHSLQLLAFASSELVVKTETLLNHRLVMVVKLAVRFSYSVSYCQSFFILVYILTNFNNFFQVTNCFLDKVLFKLFVFTFLLVV